MSYRPADLEQEPNPGLRAASTVNIRYRIDPGLGLTEDEVNARVRRISPWKDARSPSVNPVYAERTGRLTAPLLTLHETGDAWVPLSLEQSYRRRTIAAGTDHLLVQRVVRGLPTAASTARRASRRSMTSWRGSSATCARRARTCSRRICHASGSSGHVSCIRRIRSACAAEAPRPQLPTASARLRTARRHHLPSACRPAPRRAGSAPGCR
jgi:hypothetical protein